MLEANEFQSITSFTDPRDLLSIYQNTDFDLILLDINMPYIDGFEVMQELNTFKKPLQPPILIMTGLNDESKKIRALQNGAKDFIEKSFNPEEIISRVSNLLDMFLSHKLLNNYSKVLEKAVSDRTKQLIKTQAEIVERLALVAEYRDTETSAHTVRVGRYSKLIAEHLGFSKEEAELLLHAAPMHDIGKIGIPDSILLKPDGLTSEEWKIMQNHTSIGAEIFNHGSSPLMECAKTVALTHHEKWDGTGYPKGHAGQQIPIFGHIVKIADVFDALTTERPYKKAWSSVQAYELISKESGKAFDPELVKLFMDLLPKIEEIRNKFSDPVHS